MLVVELLAAWRRQRADVGEPDRTRYCCWPTDLDHSATMNHAKYLRFVNYAQRQFWMRNGVWAVCRKRSRLAAGQALYERINDRPLHAR